MEDFDQQESWMKCHHVKCHRVRAVEKSTVKDITQHVIKHKSLRTSTVEESRRAMTTVHYLMWGGNWSEGQKQRKECGRFWQKGQWRGRDCWRRECSNKITIKSLMHWGLDWDLGWMVMWHGSDNGLGLEVLFSLKGGCRSVNGANVFFDLRKKGWRLQFPLMYNRISIETMLQWRPREQANNFVRTCQFFLSQQILIVSFVSRGDQTRDFFPLPFSLNHLTHFISHVST